MRLHRSFAVLLLGLSMAAPIAVVAEDAPLAPEVQRRVAVVVLARRIRGYAAMAKASSDCCGRSVLSRVEAAGAVGSALFCGRDGSGLRIHGANHVAIHLHPSQ